MINDFIENQLALWKDARERYLELGKVQRRKFKIGDFEGVFQYNPARIVSTGAQTDDDTIKNRPCFLCRENRPKEQITVSINKDWEMAVNPYPIFPVHFTIISTSHRPQDKPPLEMAAMAEHLPELCFFFNGAKAGASAPDHNHLQAVLKTELPLLKITEMNHPTDKPGIMRSDMWGLELPFIFLSAVITDDEEGGHDFMRMLALTGASSDGSPDKGLRNVFCWKDDSGFLRMIVVPRRLHRPSMFGTEKHQLLVAPGCVDMGGVVILPRKEDFDRISEKDIKLIYKEVSC